MQASRLGMAGASFGRLKSLKEATNKLSSALDSLKSLPEDQPSDTAAVSVQEIRMHTCTAMTMCEHILETLLEPPGALWSVDDVL